jgi:hypothetical protein
MDVQVASSNSMLITCPMMTTTKVKSLNSRTMQPVKDRTNEDLSYVAWVYNGIPAPNQTVNNCDEGTQINLGIGMAVENRTGD